MAIIKHSIVWSLIGSIGILLGFLVLPFLSNFLVGPMIAMMTGIRVAYLSSTDSTTPIRHGALAGCVAGCGFLVANTLIWVVLLAIGLADTTRPSAALEAVAEILTTSGTNPANATWFALAGAAVIGSMFGMFELFISLLAGVASGIVITLRRPLAIQE